MLTVRVLRIDELLWNSTFMIDIPGAMTDEHSGLGNRELISLQGISKAERKYLKNVIPLTNPNSIHFLESG